METTIVVLNRINISTLLKKTILPTIRPVFLHVAPLFGWLKSGATYAIGPIPTVGFLEEPPI